MIWWLPLNQVLHNSAGLKISVNITVLLAGDCLTHNLTHCG